MKKRLTLLSFLIGAFCVLNVSAAGKHAIEDLPTQSGDGIVDRYMAHGREVYRFVPADDNLRMVKFVPGQLGYKKNKLSAEYEAILATALAEKKNIHLECAYFDHGAGKTAIGKKIIVLKFADDQ